MKARLPVDTKNRRTRTDKVRLTRKDYRKAGFSYVEVVFAGLIAALALVPAIDALNHGMQSARADSDRTEAHFHVISLLEEVVAEPYASLDAEALRVGDPTVATTYSDLAGSNRRRLVYLARYDGDDADGDGDRFTGGDDGLLWGRVELENTNMAFQTLTAR